MNRTPYQPYKQVPFVNPHNSYNIQTTTSAARQYNPYMNQPQWSGMGMSNQNSYGMSLGNHYPNYEGNYFHPQNAYKNSSQNIFQNPLNYYDTPEQLNGNYGHTHMQQGFMNPYPKQSFMPKKQGNMKSFMNSFKSQDGSIDFNKMMDTAGMMMSAMNQVTGLVKGVGGIFKV